MPISAAKFQPYEELEGLRWGIINVKVRLSNYGLIVELAVVMIFGFEFVTPFS